MNVSNQLKYYRNQMSLSQEELADKIYVSRQTISNWETARSYPDLRSLLLLSEIFKVSLDELVKGDVEMMNEELRKKNVKKWMLYSKIGLFGTLPVTFLLIALAVFIPLSDRVLMILAGLLILVAVVNLFISFKFDKIQKQADLQTFEEIKAYLKYGKLLGKVERPASIKWRRRLFSLLIYCAAGLAGVAIIYFLLNVFGA